MKSNKELTDKLLELNQLLRTAKQDDKRAIASNILRIKDRIYKNNIR